MYEVQINDNIDDIERILDASPDNQNKENGNDDDNEVVIEN